MYKPIIYNYQQYLFQLDFINKFNCKNLKEIVTPTEVFLKISPKSAFDETNTVYLFFLLYLASCHFPLIRIKKVSKSRKSNELLLELSVSIKKFNLISEFLVSFFIEKWGILHFNNVQPQFASVKDKSLKDIFLCRLTTSVTKFLYSESYLFESVLDYQSRQNLDSELILMRVKFSNQKNLPVLQKNKNYKFLIFSMPLFWFFLVN